MHSSLTSPFNLAPQLTCPSTLAFDVWMIQQQLLRLSSFFATLAKQFPHTVKKIYVPSDYAPIVLSGIVQRNDKLVTMELSVGFEFHMPYPTKEGHSTSLLMATGPQVTVNLIIGLPFINMSDALVEMKALDCPAFEIDFCRAENNVPALPEAPKLRRRGNQEP